MLCGSGDLAELYCARDYEHGVPGEWQVAQCRACGFCCQDPLPAPEVIPSFYPRDYAPYTSDSVIDWLFKMVYWVDARRIRKLIGPSGRVLDVGCGNGAALLALKGQGEWDLWGVEIDPAAAEFARSRGLNVQTGDLLNADLPAGGFDLIRMGHVLEHVPDPVENLKRAYNLLRPKGLLFGETVNTDCLDSRLFGKYWGGLHLPRHIVFFDRHNLAHTLERIGFSDVRTMPRLRTVGWSAGIQNFLVDRIGLKVPRNGRVQWYILLIIPFLPVTLLQSIVHRTAAMAFLGRKSPSPPEKSDR
jgi:SAM-dependent methyltransferase